MNTQLRNQIEVEHLMLAHTAKVMDMVYNLMDAPEDDQERYEYEKHEEEDNEG